MSTEADAHSRGFINASCHNGTTDSTTQQPRASVSSSVKQMVVTVPMPHWVGARVGGRGAERGRLAHSAHRPCSGPWATRPRTGQAPLRTRQSGAEKPHTQAVPSVVTPGEGAGPPCPSLPAWLGRRLAVTAKELPCILEISLHAAQTGGCVNRPHTRSGPGCPVSEEERARPSFPG